MSELGKPLPKKSDQKYFKKKQKIKVKRLHVYKKPIARKRIFVQILFPHSTLNFECKISRRKTPHSFAPRPVPAQPKSLLQFDSNHENVCEQILNEDSSPKKFKFFEL